ncbi:RNA exonuclease 3, partial [Ascosphaera pollenicola]
MATFTPLGRFKQVACPEGRRCRLFHCLFSHAHDQDDSATTTTTTTPVEAPPDWLLMASRSNTPLVPAVKKKQPEQNSHGPAGKATAEPPTKRRRVESEVPVPVPVPSQKSSSTRTETPSMRPPAAATATATAQPDVKTRQPTLQSLQKPINPPPSRPRTSLHSLSQPPSDAKTPTPAPQRRVIKKEALNPRHIGHIGKPPASHSSRMTILKKLHETLEGQNKKVIAAYKDKPAKRKLIMAEHEV